MLNVGGPELLIILLVALVFLGPQRLPDLARQMGQAVSSLRSLASGFQAELEAASRPDPDTSMKLDGPTSTSEAIARTQEPGAAGTRDPYRAQAGEAVGDGEPSKADKLAEAARQVKHDGDVKPVSAGGPQDLRPGTSPDSHPSPRPDASSTPDPDTIEPGERE